MAIFFIQLSTELLGTAILVLLGNGVVANTLLKKTKGNNQGFLAITAGWGFATFLGALVASLLNGAAQLNPAVTIAVVIQQTWFIEHGWFLLPAILIGQILGAIIAQLIVDTIYWKHIKDTVTDNPDFVLAVHATIPTYQNKFLNFFTEMIGAALLVLVVLLLSEQESKVIHNLAPLFVGFTVFAIGLGIGGPTGYAINPVRDFIPRLIYSFLPLKGKSKAQWNYSWIPVLAPITGGIIVSLIFWAL
ncbi:glycerol uptake facilitator protein [Spiroplasma syrphidicola EA-1]|uniref:Glycerol uptake facilitator protein n=1 Tax=Spiroplasma syrphidicola EA-1 TaxID=1276229 RepID=R4UM96_9MOLU|nr:MIP/aquaporin family protein [Spiroplasma syrphidicola]AGM26356.1 glycerol uptake facilitator protein [Spiroplasma syrphidicola EA-1]